MQQAYVEVGGVKTKILTWGRTLTDSSDVNDLLLVIPGNPGVTRFYTMFLQTIHERTGIPVWIVGHAGHEPPKNCEEGTPPLKGNEEVYGLEGQVRHKIQFIKNYVPRAARIHLIGHSIGAYIILQLLKDPTIGSRVAANYLLFPTIEYMSDTKNGKFMTRIVSHIVWLLVFLAFIYTCLPSFLQNFLMYLFFKVNCIPKMHMKTCVDFVNSRVLEKVFFMAFEEMDQVKERDNEIIRNNVKKIKFYYGASDDWAPVGYFTKLKEDIPEVEAEVCTRKFDHSFVLKNSRNMGNLVAEWIKERL